MDNIPEFYETDAEWEAGESAGQSESHIKGEWVTKDRAVIAKCFTGEWKNVVDKVRGGNPVEADANARLIAAAPELLAAVEAIIREPFGCPFCDSGTLRTIGKGHTMTCGFQLATAAVAKARGNAAELELQKRDGVGVFNPRFVAEDDDCREAQGNT